MLKLEASETLETRSRTKSRTKVMPPKGTQRLEAKYIRDSQRCPFVTETKGPLQVTEKFRKKRYCRFFVVCLRVCLHVGDLLTFFDFKFKDLIQFFCYE